MEKAGSSTPQLYMAVVVTARAATKRDTRATMVEVAPEEQVDQVMLELAAE